MEQRRIETDRIIAALQEETKELSAEVTQSRREMLYEMEQSLKERYDKEKLILEEALKTTEELLQEERNKQRAVMQLQEAQSNLEKELKLVQERVHLLAFGGSRKLKEPLVTDEDDETAVRQKMAKVKVLEDQLAVCDSTIARLTEEIRNRKEQLAVQHEQTVRLEEERYARLGMHHRLTSRVASVGKSKN